MNSIRRLVLPIALATSAAVGLPLALPAKATPTQAALLQRLVDENALRNLIVQYGRGNDEMSIHHADRARARQRGTAAYARAFAPNSKIEVYALGGERPIGEVTGIAAWVDFVERYYAGNGYSSTLHLMSNFDIAFDGSDRADVSAYALAPHFFVKPAAKDKASADTAIEWMLCRYAFRAERQPDGGWKIARLQVNLEEISRVPGFFPGGQRNGR